ncbi:MAG: universal stress protein [Bacteroidota bacterium]
MLNNNNHILVPMDFSEQALIALDQSYNLARLTRADITLLYVLDEEQSKFFSIFSKETKRKTEEKKFNKAIKEKLDALAKDIMNKAGIHIFTRIEQGKIYDCIVDVANELKAIFIIMGTNGQHGLKKKFIGSNALRVVKEANCPVITIAGKKHRAGCKVIVLPLDLSQETKEKVGSAIEFANHFGSAINIVSVINTNDELIVKKYSTQMKQVAAFIKKHNIVVHTEFVKDSNVLDGILKYSKKAKADLIMIMTQSEMDWTDMFIGSTAQEIINNSVVPVLSIHPMDKPEESVIPYSF